MISKYKPSKILSSPFLLIIWVYQTIISPFFAPSCRFWPSCSEYSKQAFHKHGLIGGLWLSIRRILRCHPFNRGGVDEVPEKFTLLNQKIDG